MGSELKNVIIIGAGGNLGPTVLKAFLASPFNTTVLTRQESTSVFPSHVKVIRADYSSIESLTAAFQGQDVVISLIGGEALNDQNLFIDAAIAAGVKRFLPSEYGVDTTKPRNREIVSIFEAKKATVDYLKTKEDKISWTSLQVGMFLDWCFKLGLFFFDSASKSVTLIDEGKGILSMTNLQQIAEALVKLLENPAESKNKYVRIASATASQAEMLSVAEKITGEKWTVKHLDSAELRKTGDEKLKKQDFSGIIDQILYVAFSKENLCDLRPNGLWNEKLGLEKQDLESSLRAALNGKLVGE